MSNNNQKQKTRIFFNSIRPENLNPKFRFRKVFHIQKTKNFANNTNIPGNNEGKDLSAKKEIENEKKSNSTKIFFIHKKTKRQPPPIKTIENFNSNLGNIKLSNPKNDIYIDDLKEKIQNTSFWYCRKIICNSKIEIRTSIWYTLYYKNTGYSIWQRQIS